MIDIKDVVTIRVPFPDISSELAVRSHMYTLIRKNDKKEFIKCQTFKPFHLLERTEPHRYIIEKPDAGRNPFNNDTTIDCDKSFLVDKVLIDKDLLAKRDICDELFTQIIHEISHDDFKQCTIDHYQLASVNHKIQLL